MKSKFTVMSAIIAGLSVAGMGGVSYIAQQSEAAEPFGISAEELRNHITPESDFAIIDIRNTDSYMSSHIKGSAYDDLTQKETLDKRISTIHNRIPEVAKDTKFVVMDDDIYSTKTIAQKMTESGLETYYLEGGINAWNDTTAAKESPTTISSENLWEVIQSDKDVYLLDVRQPEEIDATGITGSINIPLAEIFESKKVGGIPDDKPVVVICGSGNRATIATYELAKHGIDFQVLEGGIKSWDVYLEENSLDKI